MRHTSGTASRPPGRRALASSQVPFAYKLVLNQWLLSLFNAQRFEDLARHLRLGAEGLDENNVSRFHHALTSQLFNLTQLPTDLLLQYDGNIVAHTQRLNERRITRGEEPIVWKYFQYLTLLFAEIYLDRYFEDPRALLQALNGHIAAYNADRPESDRIRPLDEGSDAALQLNKLAFWMATGSGKTLLMHVNILQYQHYLEKKGKRRDLNRILLLTPNEGLSQQHLREFEAAGIEAELFSKDGRGLFAGQAVEILEVTRLRDDMGEKTVAVDAFEGNNLVLVDEGHRGASGGGDGAWMKFRNRLCEKGFSFEYSATFGQAVKGSPALTEQYARSILLDYSYRYFYKDGFGKDYQILNLDEAVESNHLELYLTACLLSFYQQQRLYRDREAEFRPFNLEKPLWIFVGGSVTKTLSTRDASDIVQILLFLARYLGDRAGSTTRIHRILSQGLVTEDGRDLFANRFTYLIKSGLTPEQLFQDTLALLFNAPGGGALHAENLKGVTGEIALRVGDNEPFGVINVGDDAKLLTLCEAHPGLLTGERDFATSLFHQLARSDSPINLLIGSRKFTEGWNSWRVSTMGLMNIGATEGSQIIQLFGRGVRLKGFARSLKRSRATDLPAGIERPRHMEVLETLGIFGIHADYMARFRDFLKEESLPTNEERVEILLPVIRNLGRRPLKIIRLKQTINGVTTEFGDAFRKLGPVPTLQHPDPAREPDIAYLQRNPVVLNWYPRVQALRSRGALGGETDAAARPHEAHLGAAHVAFLDLDRLYFDLERFKAERGWHNFNIARDRLPALLGDQTWYTLLIPADRLALGRFHERVPLWQEIAGALLRKYAERYYTFRKREWEMPHLEYRDLDATDPNFEGAGGEDAYYRVLIEESQAEIIQRLGELKTLIEGGTLKAWEFRALKAICFDRHLYQPLLRMDRGGIQGLEITPTPLNPGEGQFVEDLKAFHDADTAFFADRELYLLRNMSRGRGVGFFEAGNFYPDFIVWLLLPDCQHILFVDPKGLRNLGDAEPKIEFYKTIKEIEARLDDPSVHLHSFIVSSTPSHVIRMHWHVEKPEMTARHILFQQEDQATYIRSMLQTSLN